MDVDALLAEMDEALGSQQQPVIRTAKERSAPTLTHLPSAQPRTTPPSPKLLPPSLRVAE